MRVILASNNENKLREMQAILSPLGWEILRQKDVGLHLEPDENGTTFEENSKIKAVAVMEASGLPAIADDSGVAVDALRGDPGVHSARYGGEKCKTDEDRNQYLLRNMENVTDGQRGAQFVSVITMAYPDGKIVSARGELHGEILRQEQGTGGFGYDPVFFLPQLRKTYAQLTPEEKAAVSHRGKALEVFDQKLRAYLAEKK